MTNGNRQRLQENVMNFNSSPRLPILFPSDDPIPQSGYIVLCKHKTPVFIAFGTAAPFRRPVSSVIKRNGFTERRKEGGGIHWNGLTE